MKKKDEPVDLEDIKAYMRMPAKDKLRWLEEMGKFLRKITPVKNREIWEKLKTKGF